MTLNVGFTGTRYGPTDQQKASLNIILSRINRDYILHHGDCVGSDKYANDRADSDTQCEMIKIYPPNKSAMREYCHLWNKTPTTVAKEKDYKVRNQDIVRSSDVLVAVSQTSEETLRSGTWATVRHAHSKKVPVIIIWPDGTKTFYEG